MNMSRIAWSGLAAVALAGALATASSAAPAPHTPDPKVMTYTPFDKIQWVKENAKPTSPYVHILFGDPDKPGYYSELVKWTPNHMSRPHFHKYDRYITVIKGTWWVGWGTHYDPNSTYPMHVGATVRHIGGATHYDGAKGEEAIILITGEGPATSTPNEH